MTVDEQGRTFIWDAWNRLVEVKQGSTTLVEYQYDGLKRRIVEDDGTSERHLYYSDQWQVLEERVGGDTVTQYVWSAVYVDAMILRDRDADASSGNGLEERIYVLHDANYNVTALVDKDGEVIERYYYEAYGSAVYLDDAFALLPGGQSEHAWLYLHQGGRLDTITNNYHFRHRDLSPTLGRWISQDPIGFEAGDANLYRYVGNGPVGHLDPLGLWWWDDDWIELGFGGLLGFQGPDVQAAAGNSIISNPISNVGIGAATGGLAGAGTGTVVGAGVGAVGGAGVGAAPGALAGGGAGFIWGAISGGIAAVSNSGDPIDAAVSGTIWGGIGGASGGWGAGGGSTIQVGISRGSGSVPIHVTYGYGNVAGQTWAHGVGSGFHTTTAFAHPGTLVNLPPIPIFFPGRLSNWVNSLPNIGNCVGSCLRAIVKGVTGI
jgi:RHS repeat-associated protein